MICYGILSPQGQFLLGLMAYCGISEDRLNKTVYLSSWILILQKENEFSGILRPIFLVRPWSSFIIVNCVSDLRPMTDSSTMLSWIKILPRRISMESWPWLTKLLWKNSLSNAYL